MIVSVKGVREGSGRGQWSGALYTAMNIYGEMRLKIGGNQEAGGVGHGLYTSPPPTVTACQGGILLYLQQSSL